MENNTKKCPFCGEEIMAVAKKCKHCGEWLDKEENSKTKECPICGETIPESATKCEHCGEELENKQVLAQVVQANKCSFCGDENTQNSMCEHCDSEFNLIIKLVKAPAMVFADVTVFVDKEKYNLKNGGVLRLNVSNGQHKITCMTAYKCPIKRKSELIVDVKGKCFVGVKFDRFLGTIKLKEGEFKPDNKCCIIGFCLSCLGALIGLLSMVGFVLCIIGLCQIPKTKEEGKGFAIAGIIISVLLFGIYVVTNS